MNQKKMKRLSRIELLELLIASERENENLRKQIAEKTEQLNNKLLTIKNAGSLAEACITINDVVISTQAAADQYLENIFHLNLEQNEQAEEILQKAKSEAEQMLAEAKQKCLEQEEEAQKSMEETWANLRHRLEEFYEAHTGLRELVAASNSLFKD